MLSPSLGVSGMDRITNEDVRGTVLRQRWAEVHFGLLYTQGANFPTFSCDIARSPFQLVPCHVYFWPQVLLKSLVANLKSSSPTIRRTAASSVVCVCQHSRRASYFYTWLLNVLLGTRPPPAETDTPFYSRWHFNSPFWVSFLIYTSFTKFPIFSRFTSSSRRGAAQPPDPRRAVNSALPDASAAAASQHHQPQRKLRRHEEGGRHPADPRAVAPGKSWGRKTILLHLFVSPNELKLNQEITDVLCVWQGVRADPTLHAALGS